MLLLIDNYDSFVFNLARYFCELGVDARVARNDAITVDEIEQLQPHAIVLSPGPCSPDEAGICVDVVRRLSRTVPILGVCLGHQAIGAAFGASVIRAPEPVHGRTSLVTHADSVLFRGISSPFRTMRYHSLMIDRATLPADLHVTAWTSDGIVMAIQHQEHPLFGVQFHPESVLTESGHRLLSNFLLTAGMSVGDLPPGDSLEARLIGPGLAGDLGQSRKHWADDASVGPPLHW